MLGKIFSSASVSLHVCKMADGFDQQTCGVAEPTMVVNCFQLVIIIIFANVGLMRYFARGPKYFMLTTLAMVLLVLCAGLDFPVWSLEESVAHMLVLG